jgi:hypothetical protein
MDNLKDGAGSGFIASNRSFLSRFQSRWPLSALALCRKRLVIAVDTDIGAAILQTHLNSGSRIKETSSRKKI